MDEAYLRGEPDELAGVPLSFFTSPVAPADTRAPLEFCEAAERDQVEASRRHLGVIFDMLTDAISIYDAAGHVVHMNCANLALFGIDPEAQDYYQRSAERRMSAFHIRDLSGRPMRTDEWPLTRVLRGDCLRGETAADILIHTLDKQEKVVSVTGAPLRDAAGAITGAICVFRDVTSRRQLMRELSARGSATGYLAGDGGPDDRL